MKAKVVLGVGGIVIRQGQVLMVQHNYGAHDGCWLLPGGHVQPDENLDAAVEREVQEETGVRARALGVAAVRSWIREDDILEVYIVFLMEDLGGAPRCCPDENSGVAFFSWPRLETFEPVTPLSKEIAKSVLTGNYRLLNLRSDFLHNSPSYRLYI